MAKRITDHDQARRVRLNQKRARKAIARRQKKEKQLLEQTASPLSLKQLSARDKQFLVDTFSRNNLRR